jgi:hypothetical protein
MVKQISEVFTGKDKDGKEVELHVRRPQPSDGEKARMTYNKTLAKSLKDGAMLRMKLESYMREQNLWDDNKQERVNTIFAKITAGKIMLEKGGIKLSEARKIALEMGKARDELVDILSEKNSLEANTAEGQAQNMEFNHLVSLCTVYNDTGKPYYVDMDAYLKDDSETALKAANALASLLYNTEESKRELPENQFLLKRGFVDEKFRLVDKNGRLVNEAGELINEAGERVNENNEPIDKNGNPIKPIEFQPFLDDDGNPVE